MNRQTTANERALAETISQPGGAAPPPPKAQVKAARPSANLQRCKDAADIAFQVIAHLAGRKVTVEQPLYEAIYAVSQIDDGELSSETEFAFWSAYAQIVEKLEDEEDAEGIYFTSLFEMRKSGKLSATADFHRSSLTWFSRGIVAMAVFVLVLLIALLAYGNVINSMVNAIDQLNTERQAIEGGRLENTRLANEPELDCRTPENAFAKQICGQAVANIISEVESTVVLLSKVNVLGPSISGAGPVIDQIDRLPEIRMIAQQTFTFLEVYIYPLLAGALGACVSLLREIFANLTAKRLHLRLFKSAYLRIAVGTIAGIVVGWVSSPEAVSGISLTPLAMAFAAGYAVEIIYSILDRFVAAFSDTDKKAA